MNQWTITKDHIYGGQDVGTIGPRIATLSAGEIIKEGYHFKLYDDDGNLYYEGYSTTNDDESAFGPLWDFGMPNAGCTGIKYRDKSGKYEWL
jgi:hypothetical protein